MPGVPSFVEEGPWWWLFGFLCLVVFVRTQATYWVGRWARQGADVVAGRSETRDDARAKIARRFSGPGMAKAQAFSERWGWFAIPLSFLTLGIQTLVNGAAGYARMRWDLYTLAMIPGCLLWATVYTVVGASLWTAWSHSPWLIGVVVLAVAVPGAVMLVRKRRAAARGASSADSTGASSPAA